MQKATITKWILLFSWGEELSPIFWFIQMKLCPSNKLICPETLTARIQLMAHFFSREA
jgi:hypothetical protein